MQRTRPRRLRGRRREGGADATRAVEQERGGPKLNKRVLGRVPAVAYEPYLDFFVATGLSPRLPY